MGALRSQIDAYVEKCREIRRLSPHTISAYENDLRQFDGCLPLDTRITGDLIRGCLMAIAQDATLAPASIRRKIASIRAFLRATDERLALQTFGNWRLKLKAPRRLPKAIARRQLAVLLDRARAFENDNPFEDPTHLCLVIMASTGLRVSELCALRIAMFRPTQGDQSQWKGCARTHSYNREQLREESFSEPCSRFGEGWVWIGRHAVSQSSRPSTHTSMSAASSPRAGSQESARSRHSAYA